MSTTVGHIVGFCNSFGHYGKNGKFAVDSSKKQGGGIICGVNIYNIFVKGEGNGSNQKTAGEYGV